ncbi:MAG: hypothetical protein IJO22_02705 [Oscillospiraceae bacterium]|nr:hypothetical protein [Oscillospiraceae bacterium]
MKNEKFYEAMENINDELILGAIEEPKRKIHPIKKIKWTVLAAAIALLLAVPVVAEVFGFTLSFNESGDYWEATTNTSFALEEYSEEVRKVKGQEYFVMQNMTEAEEFIGIDMPDNAVIEKAYPFYVQMDFFSKGYPQRVHCDVFVGENEGNLLVASAEAWYVFKDYKDEGIVADDIIANVFYKAVCDRNPSGHTSGYGFEVDENSSESEKYVTTSGRECEIVLINGEFEYREKAFTVVDRIFVVIEVSGNDKEEVRKTITEILDAYN